MARLIGPDEASRLVYSVGTSDVVSVSAFTQVTFYTDAGLTSPASLLTLAGGATTATQTTDKYGMLPLVQFPDGVDTLYVSAAGGPSWPVYARTDDRLDALTSQINANLLSSGEETYPRQTRMDSNNLVSGGLQLTYFTAAKTEASTQVRVISGGTATATPTLVRVGLYSIATNGNGTLVAATASDTSMLVVTNTVYPKAWTAPVNKVAGQRYALAVLVVAATAGSLTSLTTSALPASELAMAPRITGRLTGQTDLPATFTDAALAAVNFPFYGVVMP